MFIEAFTHATGVRVAEVGYLLIAFAGIWLVAAEALSANLAKLRTTVAGMALALGGALLVVATHWGKYS